MHRFFVSPDLFHGSAVIVTGSQAHQMRRVLRLQPGAEVVLLDNTGRAYAAQVVGYTAEDVRLEVTRAWQAAGEPRVHLTLYQSLLKGDRFEWVLQKGTELGVSAFVPLVCARNVVEERSVNPGKTSRWQRIILEAAEQSGRARLPELAEPHDLQARLHALGADSGDPILRLIPWEGEQSTGLRAALAGCNLGPGSRIEVYVGPEGGLTEDEVRLAATHGVTPVSLGPRILRAETAGLVAASVVFYQAGDMEPGVSAT